MDVTLDSVIRGYLVSQGKNTLHGYLRLMKFAVEFLRELSLDHPFLDKTIQLKMDERKCVAWPDDCILWNKLGVGLGDRVFVFERDSTISLFKDTTEDNPSGTANSSWDGLSLPMQAYPEAQLNNYLHNGELGYLTGYRVKRGHNFTGYFSIDWQNKEFHFSSDVSSDTNIYLEYRTNGFVLKTKSVIPEFAAIMAERYIHWQSARYDKRFGDGSVETQARKLSYDQAHADLVRRTIPVSYADIVGGVARGFDRGKIVR